jgi:RHS repeat-associated protein
VTNSAGTVLSLNATSYDKAGNVAAQTNGLGKSTSYAYDSLNREISVTDPAGRTTHYGYDPAGNRTSVTDPQGRIASYGYDAGNELTSISYSDGVTPNVTYSYDADGQRTSMTDGTGTSTSTYDALHRLTADTQGDGETITYGYDLAGSLTSIAYPGGSCTTPASLCVTRAYDTAGRLTAVSDWLGHTTKFGYDADANLTSETYPNGVLATFTYDGADELTHIADAKGTSALLGLAYTHDKVGLITAENSADYGYDAANRLISSTVGPTPLSYDQADQFTGLGAATLGYNPASELTTQTGPAGTTTYTYDKQGNRTSATPPSGPAANYTYDQAGRLTGFTQGSTTASYSYDGNGLRTAKKVGTTTTPFAWDLAEGLPLIIQAGPTSYLTGPGGLPLEQVQGSTVLYYHQGQLGSTRLLTDASGAVAATFSYDPYGAIAAHTGTATTPFGFAGQYTDAESGLIYLRARYYDPATGQFITRDPAVRETRQPYAYVNDSPANGIDPAGLGDCPNGVAIPFTDLCLDNPLDLSQDAQNFDQNSVTLDHTPVIGQLIQDDPFYNDLRDGIYAAQGLPVCPGQIFSDAANTGLLFISPGQIAEAAGFKGGADIFAGNIARLTGNYKWGAIIHNNPAIEATFNLITGGVVSNAIHSVLPCNQGCTSFGS